MIETSWLAEIADSGILVTVRTLYQSMARTHGWMCGHWFAVRIGGSFAPTRMPAMTKEGSIISSSSRSFTIVSSRMAELLSVSFSTYMVLCLPQTR